MDDTLTNFAFKQLDDFLHPYRVAQLSYVAPPVASTVLAVIRRRFHVAASGHKGNPFSLVATYQTVLSNPGPEGIAVDHGLQLNDVHRVLNTVAQAVGFFVGFIGPNNTTMRHPSLSTVLHPLLETTTTYLHTTSWPQIAVPDHARALRDAINTVHQNGKGIGSKMILVPRQDLETIQYGAQLLARNVGIVYDSFMDMARTVRSQQLASGSAAGITTPGNNYRLQAPMGNHTARPAPQVSRILHVACWRQVHI